MKLLSYNDIQFIKLKKKTKKQIFILCVAARDEIGLAVKDILTDPSVTANKKAKKGKYIIFNNVLFFFFVFNII